MNHFFSRIERFANFKRPTQFLVISNAISHLFPFLASLFITLLYTPADFGVYSKFYSLVFILSPLASAKYDMAILLSDSHEERKKLAYLSLFTSLIISICMLILFLILYCTNVPFFRDMHLILIILTPLSFFLIAVSNLIYYYYNQNGNFFLTGILRIVRSIVISVLFILFGFIISSYYGLILADILSYVCSLTIFIPSLWRIINFTNLPSKTKLIDVANKYINFPKFQILSGVIEKMSQNLPIILFGILYSQTEQGLIAFSLRILAAPVTLISGSIGDVFQKKASDQYLQFSNCYDLFMATSKKLFYISIIPFVLALFFLKPIGSFILNESSEWHSTLNIIVILLPYLFFQFNVSCLGRMLTIAGKLKIDLYIQISLLIGLTVAIIVGKFFFQDFYLSIVFFVIVYCLKYTYEFIYSKKLSKSFSYDRTKK